MNFEFFIAKRMLSREDRKKSISKPIVRIAVLGIALGMAIMLLTVCIVKGFQGEIRDKVVGFGSHIQINEYGNYGAYESTSIPLEQPFYPSLEEHEKVRHIQPFAFKPGIIKTKTALHGIISKGIDQRFDWGFFADKIIEGQALDIQDNSLNKGVLISKKIQQLLQLELGQEVELFFFRASNKPKRVVFEVQGIYETGLEEFDKEFVLIDIQHIQKINKWGIETYLKKRKSSSPNGLCIQASSFGGNKNYIFDWQDGRGYTFREKIWIKPQQDTTLCMISSDFEIGKDSVYPLHLPDTAYLTLKFEGEGTLNWDPHAWSSSLTTTGGTHQQYVGGFEVLLHEYEDLHNTKSIYTPENSVLGLTAQPITTMHPEIFNWLKFLDKNVQVIVILLITVSTFNMIAALLVILLERTNMIGTLKALGASTWQVQQVFLYNALLLVGKGILWGNLVGLGIAILQYATHIFPLPQESYYMRYVPIRFDWVRLLELNGLTILICAAVLLLPTLIVSKISPIKAIRFR